MYQQPVYMIICEGPNHLHEKVTRFKTTVYTNTPDSDAVQEFKDKCINSGYMEAVTNVFIQELVVADND